jgi:predicted Zn-dependent protease
MNSLRFGLLLALLGTTASGQQFEGVNAFSLEKEAALGTQMAVEVRSHTTPVNSDHIQSYAEQTGRRLSHYLSSPFPWTFAVVIGLPDGRTHEPVAVPGGYFFIPASLILNANSEDEFAGMLAHAMAHVALRDATRTASPGQTGQSGTIPLIFIGGWAGHPGQLTVPKGLLALEKAIEGNADAAAIRVLRDAGYNPEALIQYVARVQPENLGDWSPLPQRNVSVKSIRNVISEAEAASSH